MNRQFYSDSSFDRAGYLRDSISISDDGNIGFLMKSEIFFFKKKDDGFGLKFFPLNDIIHLSDKIYFLGRQGGKNLWCVDLYNNDSTNTEAYLKSGAFKNLRKVVSRLEQQAAALAAYAKGLADWNRFQTYCSICGSKTGSEQHGHSRKCLNPSCGQIFFPRITPAIIVLIEHKTKQGKSVCLLNRRKVKNGYRCSTLAGFVEVGENLEDAVIREMKEEVDVDVTNIRYVASQPWPFPSSLMVGFIAEATTTSFKVDGCEIKDAKWYSAKEIKHGVENNKLVLSKEDSIARYLIETWVKNNEA